MCLAFTLAAESRSRGCARRLSVGGQHLELCSGPFPNPCGATVSWKDWRRECPAPWLVKTQATIPWLVKTQATILVSSDKPLGATHMARSPLPLHPPAMFSKPRSAHLPLPRWAVTVCPLERSGWWLEGGQSVDAKQVGAGLVAPHFRTSALGSTRLHLGFRPRSYKVGKGVLESLSLSRRKLPSAFSALAQSCADTGHSKINSTQLPPSRSSKSGGLHRLRQGSDWSLGKRA